MKIISEEFKNTLFLRAYATAKIPLLAFIWPKIIELSQNKTILQVPLTYRSKNHLGTMYFGALSMGAEASVALTAVKKIHESGQKIDYVFKDFKAQFLKRAEGDVHFICEAGVAVAELVEKGIQTGERQTQTFKSYAIVPSKDPQQIIAEFEVTLSLKKRS